jgi:hypothetical protein
VQGCTGDGRWVWPWSVRMREIWARCVGRGYGYVCEVEIGVDACILCCIGCCLDIVGLF